VATASDRTLEVLRQEIRKQMDTHSNKMIRGEVEDYPEYRGLVGAIYGLGLAERLLLDLDNQMKHDD
jgi:hypothetical protein